MRRYAEDLTGRTFAVCGGFRRWQEHLGPSVEAALEARGARVVALGADVDVLVVGEAARKGRADALRKAERLQQGGAALRLMDEAELLHLLRLDLQGAHLFFAGGFERADPGVAASQPPVIAAQAGAVVVDTLDESVDYVVLGPKRAAGKAAAERRALELRAAGALEIWHEPTFFEVMRQQAAPGEAGGLSALLVELNAVLEPKRLRRALDMLRKESFTLYADAGADRLVGVVRSQTSDGVYSNVLYGDGRYDCCSQDLEECMGLQGTVCKHLMVLMLGLAQAGTLEVPTLVDWAGKAARKRGPAPDRDVLADTFLRYKAAEAGEVDWRPTETLPEDFYAF
ncbi:MAG: hypothetical protein R3F59_15460 [Myxococcota bacterium]